ncbi:hypothetical protein CL654_02035 [bacterium]|nr:hypothetical protein [bacterium]|tara:strand:+ start:15075 stop:16175 length:1101 start_codon:yes stop_codon:yes gene_type:complete
MKWIFDWLINLFGKKDIARDTDESFFRPILFLFPNILKESVSSETDVKDWQKDYLSKNKNIEKYIFNACEALQVCGISYTKYKKELKRYSDEELNKGAGEIVGRNFEIEARLMLRRMLELYVESWHFKEIKNDKETIFRHYFLLRNLKAFYSRKTNTKDFCDFDLEFDTKAISEIRTALNNLSVQNPFYLTNNKDPNKDSDVKKLFKHFRDLLVEAMPKMTDGLREMVGESYQLYAETSEVVHGFSGGPNFNLRNYHQEITALYARSAVLASNILKYLVVIGDNQISNTEIKEAINGLRTDDLPHSFMFEVGDKVLVLGQIKAEITEISQSKYGCKKYKVKYNDKREDWSWSFEREWFLLKELTKL